MGEWLAELAGENLATALTWTAFALLLLLILLAVARIIRSLRTGTFVAGGRNRQPRLAVVDAAAVDNQRRLVLVRRDEVEHLILIGGPTDIVVEQEIRARHTQGDVPQRREPQPVNAPPAPPAATPRPAAPPPPRAPERASPPPRQEPRVEPQAPVRAEPRQAPPPVQQNEPRAAAAAAPQGAVRREPEPQPRDEDEEIALLRELDLAIDEPRHNAPKEAPAERKEPSIEDEMSRLLDDLSESRDKQR